MSGLNLQLQALSVPAGTEFPGTVQENLVLTTQYVEIVGGENFSGVAYGDVEPAPEQRDLAWDKRDGSGNPLGWYGWDGSAWVPFPSIIPSGVTAARPVSPPEGTQFFDSQIDVALIYAGGSWITLSGSPGDVKEVKADSLADAITRNPGWAHDSDSVGKVIQGAAADGSDYDDDIGENEVTLTEDQMPEHTHEDLIVSGSEADNGDNGNLCVMAATQPLGTKTVLASQTGPKGGSDPVSVVQATKIYFRLYKL